MSKPMLNVNDTTVTLYYYAVSEGRLVCIALFLEKAEHGLYLLDVSILGGSVLQGEKNHLNLQFVKIGSKERQLLFSELYRSHAFIVILTA